MIENSPNLLSIIPPVVALSIVMWKRQIIPALFIGGLSGAFILSGFNPGFFFHYLNLILDVLGNRGSLELILFSLLIGGLIKGIEQNEGFSGFVALLGKHRKGNSKGSAFGLTWIIGAALFLENWSNILINGTTMGPIYRKLGINRAKLAYFIHTISINLVALVLINSWGAFYIFLLEGQNVGDSFLVVLKSVPLNFYCLISLMFVGIVMIFNLDIGPIRKYKDPEDIAPNPGDLYGSSENKSRLMIIPLVIMIVTLIGTLFVTGEGKITAGSGTTAVFYSVVTAIIALFILLRFGSKVPFGKNLKTIYNGVGDLIPLGMLLVFALTLGRICNDLGTGVYIAEFASDGLPHFAIPAVFFLIACIISFSTGTSYGTFSIMIPLAVPLATATGIDLSLIFAACISGGVFGDNCSPISDTSIVTGLAARIDVVDHIRTQIPYALISASFATILFLIAGAIL
jgi:tetracycline resistance efflux pump